MPATSALSTVSSFNGGALLAFNGKGFSTILENNKVKFNEFIFFI